MDLALHDARAMRAWLGLVMVVVGACSRDEGAVLTFAAPEGPASAARIEIVLANADAETIGTGIRQRTRPGVLTEEDVVYYRQRARGGALDAVATVDGFSVRIEPEIEIAPDEAFIPFAFLFDASDALIGIGAVNDADGSPMPVTITEGALAKYTLTVTAVTVPGADVALARDQGTVVSCRTPDAAWTSGFAWRPETGPQLRLLLGEDTATDASERAADLDCDTFEAGRDDCDDLRSAYHPNQPESCDGLDTDCDGQRVELLACPPTIGDCGSTRVAACTDETIGQGTATSACVPDPSCVCASTQNQCAHCTLTTRAGSGASAVCAPAIGKIHFACPANSCTVEIVEVTGPFDVYLGVAQDGPFVKPRLMNAPGLAYLRVKSTTATPPTTGTPMSAGKVMLAVSTEERTEVVGVDLQIDPTMDSACIDSPTPGDYVMSCSP